MKGLDNFLKKSTWIFSREKHWKWQHAGGGVTKLKLITIINILMCLLVFSINLIDQISKDQSLLERWDKTIPFLLLAGFCYFANKHFKLNAYLYAFISIIILLTTEQTGDLTGIIFLVFSLYIFRSKILSSIIILGTLITISTKVFYSFSGNQMLILLVAYIYTLAIYYILIHPKSDNKITVICPELDAETLKILQKLYLGCSVKDISDMVYLTQDAVSKRIGRARVTMGAKTTAHLLAICRENGYIRYNLDNQAKAL